MRRFFTATTAFLVLAGLLAIAAGPVAAKDLIQSKCPVMGNTPNEELYTDYKGKRIYFCCPPCIEKFKKNPDKYMGEMQFQGIKLEDAPSQK